VFPWGNTVVSYRDTHFEVSASAPSADTASSTDTAARKKEKVHRANIFHVSHYNPITRRESSYSILTT
jgi:hypothetical protein